MNQPNWQYCSTSKLDEYDKDSNSSQNMAQNPQYLDVFAKPLDPLSPNVPKEDTLMDISPLKLEQRISFDITRLDIMSQSPLFTPQKKIAINRNLHSNIFQTPNSAFCYDNDFSPFETK